MPERLEQVQKALLDLFTTLTGLPVMLLEKRNGKVEKITTTNPIENFKPHCQTIRTYNNASCEADEKRRALAAIKSGKKALHVCHAGMFNEEIPIKVGNEVKAVLLYGQMQVEGREDEALERHLQVVDSLSLSSPQAEDLRKMLFDVRKYTDSELDIIRNSFIRVENALYTLFEDEALRERHLEKITHELQTRIQAVIAHAENFVLEAVSLKPHLVKKWASEILYSAEALDTVVQNLEEYTEAYNFTKESIEPLILESKRIYQPEAKRREISIYVELKRVNDQIPVLEVSTTHLQYAFNNLMHNAIKYSFKGTTERPRYVKITGKPAKGGYEITFENYGVGIKPEEIASRAIFKANYQGKLTQGEYRTGAGKGLYFVDKTIANHNGHIVAFSDKVGSSEVLPEGQPHINRFVIFLPFEQPKEK